MCMCVHAIMQECLQVWTSQMNDSYSKGLHVSIQIPSIIQVSIQVPLFIHQEKASHHGAVSFIELSLLKNKLKYMHCNNIFLYVHEDQEKAGSHGAVSVVDFSPPKNKLNTFARGKQLPTTLTRHTYYILVHELIIYACNIHTHTSTYKQI